MPIATYESWRRECEAVGLRAGPQHDSGAMWRVHDGHEHHLASYCLDGTWRKVDDDDWVLGTPEEALAYAVSKLQPAAPKKEFHDQWPSIATELQCLRDRVTALEAGTIFDAGPNPRVKQLESEVAQLKQQLAERDEEAEREIKHIAEMSQRIADLESRPRIQEGDLVYRPTGEVRAPKEGELFQNRHQEIGLAQWDFNSHSKFPIVRRVEYQAEPEGGVACFHNWKCGWCDFKTESVPVAEPGQLSDQEEFLKHLKTCPNNAERILREQVTALTAERDQLKAALPPFNQGDWHREWMHSELYKELQKPGYTSRDLDYAKQGFQHGHSASSHPQTLAVLQTDLAAARAKIVSHEREMSHLSQQADTSCLAACNAQEALEKANRESTEFVEHIDGLKAKIGELADGYFNSIADAVEWLLKYAVREKTAESRVSQLEAEIDTQLAEIRAGKLPAGAVLLMPNGHRHAKQDEVYTLRAIDQLTSHVTSLTRCLSDHIGNNPLVHVYRVLLAPASIPKAEPDERWNVLNAAGPRADDLGASSPVWAACARAKICQALGDFMYESYDAWLETALSEISRLQAGQATEEMRRDHRALNVMRTNKIWLDLLLSCDQWIGKVGGSSVRGGLCFDPADAIFAAAKAAGVES